MNKATEKTENTKTSSTCSSPPSSPAPQLVEAVVKPTPKLRKFKKIPIFIVENHNDVLEFLYKCFAKRYLPFEHNLMIHFDSHPDMCFPNFDSHLAYDKEELLQQLSIENWIMPTVFVGLFDKLVWVKREFAKQIPCGRHELVVGEHENKIKIFSNLDYFITDGAFCLKEKLQKAKSCTLDVMELDGQTSMGSLFSTDRFANNPTFSYALDIDLDYFSTKNPFLTLYEKADLYNKLKSIYITDKAEDYDVNDVESIARFVRSRNDQLDKLEEIFQHLESDDNLDDFFAEDQQQCSLVEQVKSLADCLKTHYPNEPFDWAVIHAAGCTCDLDGTELPHHISTDIEIEESLKQFCTFLKQLTTKLPTVVTISRSSEDDYTPKEQVDYIERSVVETLQAIFHENITQEPIFYYKNEEYQFERL
jgi:hypothetical protein